MESDKIIQQKASLVDETLIDLVKGTILASRDLGAKPNALFVGADAPYYANNYQRIAYRLVISGTIQIGMLKWSRKYGPNTLFDKKIKTSAPQVFVLENYEGEWLDRAKIYYSFQRQVTGRELESISQLYSGPMSEDSLIGMAMGSDEQAVLGDSPDIGDAVKFITKLIDGNFSNPVAGMDFLHWLGSIITIIITVDHNSAQYIFRTDRQFLSPEEINLISQFGELCDASIQTNPSLPSYSGVSLSLLDRKERSVINEQKEKLLEEIANFEGDEKQMRKAIAKVINEIVSDLTPFAQKVLENELYYTLLFERENSKENPNDTDLRKIGRYLKFHTNSKIEGNSTFFIFTFDVEDVHKVVTRREITEIIPCDRPREKFLEALVFKHFSGISEKLFRKEKIILRLKGGIQSIIPLTNGLTSTQLIKTIEKAIKEEVFRVKSKENKETDIIVDISLKVFQDQRREMLSNMEDIKIPFEDELIDFNQVAGHKFVKFILNLFVVQFLAANGYSKVLPQGVILAGPPGTGKSYIAYAIAKVAIALGWVFVEWDPQALKRGIVGESEKMFRDRFDFFGSFDKLILWVDEGDVAFGSRGAAGDSGVTATLFAMTLRFFGSASRIGKTMLITATNRVEDLDPALRRRLPMTAYMPKLDEEGVKEISILRFEHALANIDPNIEFEGSMESIAAAIYKANSGLVGSQLIFAINILIAYSYDQAKNKKKVVVKKEYIDLLLKTMSTRMSEDDTTASMDRESKLSATWRSDFRITPKKQSKVSETKTTSKDEDPKEDDALDM